MDKNRTTTIVIFAGFAALAALLLAPGILGGRIFLDSYVLADLYPRFAWARRALLAGNYPLFAPDYAQGFPIALDHFGLIHPAILIVLRLLPLLPAYHLLIAACLAVGSMITYACGRRVFGLSRPAAMLAAFAFPYASFMAFWSREFTWAPAIGFFPLVLLVVHWLKAGSWRRVFGSGILLGVLLPATYIEMVMYAFVLGTAFALVEDAGSGPGWNRLRTTIRFVLVGAAAALVASPWLVPAAALVMQTNRAAGGISPLAAGNVGKLGLGDLVQLFFPTIQLPFSPVSWFSLSAEGARLFAGIIPLPFVLLVTFRGPRNRRAWFLIGAAAVALAVMLPGSPLYRLLYALPGLNSFRFAWKWLPLFLFVTSLLAGIGFDRWWQTRGENRLLVDFGRLSAVLVVGFIGTGIILRVYSAELRALAERLFVERFYTTTTLGRPLEHYRAVIARAYEAVLRSFDILSLGSLAALLPLLVLAIGFGFRRFREHRALPGILLATTVLSLGLAAYAATPWTSRSLLDPSPATTYLRAQPGRFRIAPFIPYLSDYRVQYSVDDTDPRTNSQIGHDLLHGNWALLDGFDSVLHSTSFMTARPARMVYAVAGNGARDAAEYEKNLRVPPEERIAGFSRVVPLLQMMSVRYALSSFPLRAPFVQETKLETMHGYPVYVYRVPDPLPFAFAAPAVTFLPEGDDRRAQEAVLSEQDFRSHTYIECNGCPGALPPRATVRVAAEQPDATALDVTTDVPTWIVFSQAYLPNWEAAVDGTPTRIYRANYLYQAVLVPAGTHTLTFRFRTFWSLTNLFSPLEKRG